MWLLLYREVQPRDRRLPSETRRSNQTRLAEHEEEDAADAGQIPLRLQLERLVSHLAGHTDRPESRVPNQDVFAEAVAPRMYQSHRRQV